MTIRDSQVSLVKRCSGLGLLGMVTAGQIIELFGMKPLKDEGPAGAGYSPRWQLAGMLP